MVIKVINMACQDTCTVNTNTAAFFAIIHHYTSDGSVIIDTKKYHINKLMHTIVLSTTITFQLFNVTAVFC